MVICTLASLLAGSRFEDDEVEVGLTSSSRSSLVNIKQHTRDQQEQKSVLYIPIFTMASGALPDSTKTLSHVVDYWQRKKGISPIYDFLLPEVDIVNASKGSVTSRLPLTDKHLNANNTIHGAVIASIVDWAGGLAIASHGLEATGVSISIHVDYIGIAKAGDTIEIEATANKVGRTMAFTTIKISRVSDGAVVATASHTKYITRPRDNGQDSKPKQAQT